MSPAVVPPVGARIRQARLERGTSLRALAREVGVSASLVSQIETGKSQPSVSTLYAITTALGISVESLFDARASSPVAGAGTPGSLPHALAAFAADPGGVSARWPSRVSARRWSWTRGSCGSASAACRARRSTSCW
ncbi:hypothetical protein SPURM210S_04698 [Streptomyces purpurascens]